MTSRVREAGAVAAIFCALAVVATYPLIWLIRNHIASDVGDPLLVSWMLAWDADRMRHGLAGIWDAPNFFPYRHTLLYSEHFLGVALFTAPVQWLARNPILVYNLAFLGSYVVTGVGMYVLARSLAGRGDAALVAAFIFTCHPFRASHISHLQLLVVGWLPLSIWALHRYFRTAHFGNLIAATAFFLLQATTSGYFAYFGLVPLLIVGIWEMWCTRPRIGRLVGHAAIAAALAFAVMLPIISAYSELRRESGLRRPLEEIVSQSADVADYMSASPSLRLWGGLGAGRGEHELFPGLVAVILAVLAFRSRERRAIVWLYAVVLLTAVVLSFGPAPQAFGRPFGVPGPYALLLRVTPGLDGIRVPARLAVVAQMALAVLAAFGAKSVLECVGTRRLQPSVALRVRAARLILVTLLIALIAAEGWAKIGTPSFEPDGNPRDRDAYAYLESLPRGAAMELPTFAEHVLDEFAYQYMTLVHRHPIVNGHSGYVTPLAVWLRGGHSPLREAGRQSDAVAMLRSLGVRYLVVHRSAYEDHGLRDELLRVIAEEPQVIAHRDFADITIGVLAPFDNPTAGVKTVPVPSTSITARSSDGADRLPFLFDGDRDSRWLTARPQNGSEWLELGLDHARNVRVIRLQLGTRSFGDYPRELSIDALEGTNQRTLFRGSVLPQFARGVLHDGEYPFIDVVLPSNRATTLRLSQHGKTRTFFWSIHEIEVLEHDRQ